jgi:RecA/RadA recombinase
LGALVADKLINDAVNKGRQAGDMGLTAKAKNSLMKAVLMPALKTNTSFVVVNHVYDDPSSMFPSKVKSQSGGQGLKYAAHLIIQCHKRFEKNENKKEEGNDFVPFISLHILDQR